MNADLVKRLRYAANRAREQNRTDDADEFSEAASALEQQDARIAELERDLAEANEALSIGRLHEADLTLLRDNAERDLAAAREALTRYAAHRGDCARRPGQWFDGRTPCTCGLDAADLICSLERQCASLAERIVELERDKESYRNTANQMATRAAAAESSLQAAREALTPLADIPIDDFDAYRGRPDETAVMGWNRHIVTIGDVRKARAALSGQPSRDAEDARRYRWLRCFLRVQSQEPGSWTRCVVLEEIWYRSKTEDAEELLDALIKRFPEYGADAALSRTPA